MNVYVVAQPSISNDNSLGIKLPVWPDLPTTLIDDSWSWCWHWQRLKITEKKDWWVVLIHAVCSCNHGNGISSKVPGSKFTCMICSGSTGSVNDCLWRWRWQLDQSHGTKTSLSSRYFMSFAHRFGVNNWKRATRSNFLSFSFSVLSLLFPYLTLSPSPPPPLPYLHFFHFLSLPLPLPSYSNNNPCCNECVGRCTTDYILHS